MKEKRKFKKTDELVLPPKNWKRISSTNSVVRKDKSSLKLSTSADSSDDVFSVSTLTCINKGIRQFGCFQGKSSLKPSISADSSDDGFSVSMQKRGKERAEKLE